METTEWYWKGSNGQLIEQLIEQSFMLVATSTTKDENASHFQETSHFQESGLQES
jgi:hypothetical protein